MVQCVRKHIGTEGLALCILNHWHFFVIDNVLFIDLIFYRMFIFRLAFVCFYNEYVLDADGSLCLVIFLVLFRRDCHCPSGLGEALCQETDLCSPAQTHSFRCASVAAPLRSWNVFSFLFLLCSRKTFISAFWKRTSWGERKRKRERGNPKRALNVKSDTESSTVILLRQFTC